MGKYSHTVLCQTCVNAGQGIIIGTVNRLELNKWAFIGMAKGGVWQLIAIFGKVKSFGFMVHGFFIYPPYEP
jgi:hypothetical protein